MFFYLLICRYKCYFNVEVLGLDIVDKKFILFVIFLMLLEFWIVYEGKEMKNEKVIKFWKYCFNFCDNECVCLIFYFFFCYKRNMLKVIFKMKIIYFYYNLFYIF